MSELSLEWSSPPGPATLALLAGRWRRLDDPAAAGELFRVRVPVAIVDAPTIAAAALPAPGAAVDRLRRALQRPRDAVRRAEVELLRALAEVDGSGPDEVGRAAEIRPADRSDEVGRAVLDLLDRAAAPARVETRLADHTCLVTDIATAGSLVTRVVAAAPPALTRCHHQAVAAALMTRVAMLRVALETAQLAAVIAGAAGPAAVWLALPLAWRFLHALLAEPASPDGV